MEVNDVKLMDIIKLVFCKKKYISELCVEYACPEGVRDHLLFLVNTYPIFSKYLRADIERLKELEDYNKETEELNQQSLELEQGGCYDCPWGNGEGGCTIGYCQDSDFDV